MTDAGPARMDALAKGAFGPVYPAIAGQIARDTGVTGGVCLDLGSGPAHLAVAMAKISDLSICAVDRSGEAARIARENIAGEGLASRITAVTGDVGSLPFRDSSAEMVVSRGSVFFWEDKVRAFREISRVLKPGAYGYIGGGMGSAGIKALVDGKRQADRAASDQPPRPRISREEMEEVMAEAGIPGYEIRSDSSGFWVIICKE